MMILVPGEASLAQLESLWRGEDEVALHADMRGRLRQRPPMCGQRQMVMRLSMV